MNTIMLLDDDDKSVLVIKKTTPDDDTVSGREAQYTTKEVMKARQAREYPSMRDLEKMITRRLMVIISVTANDVIRA